MLLHKLTGLVRIQLCSGYIVWHVEVGITLLTVRWGREGILDHDLPRVSSAALTCRRLWIGFQWITGHDIRQRCL